MVSESSGSSTNTGVTARQPISLGGTSELLPWNNNRVLKLCFDWVPATIVEREFAVTRTVHALGLPVPSAHEIVQVGRRWGIVFDRVDGRSLLEQVQARPWRLFSAARQLAELHARLHACPAPPGLPSQTEQIGRWIDAADITEFSEARRESARRLLARFGEGDIVCHGDFHPGNILLTARGPVIIDWSTGTRGHAFADVARTSVLFERADLPPHASWYMHLSLKIARRLLHATYLKRYLQLRSGTRDDVDLWRDAQRAFESAWRVTRGRAE